MAAPHVAGLAALIRGYAPTLTNDEIRELIQDTADKVGSQPYVSGRNDHFGYGRINVRKALSPAMSLSSEELLFLASNTTTPGSRTLFIYNSNPAVPLNWTATRTSGGSWLTFNSASGTATPGSPGQVTISAQKPTSYGVYTGNIRISSSPTAEGSPVDIPVTLVYVPTLQRLFLPMGIKGYTPATVE